MSDYDFYGWRDRLACNILDDMRQCCKNMNFGTIPGLIEELQIVVNRMESSLEDKRDYHRLTRDLKKDIIGVDEEDRQKKLLEIAKKHGVV